MGAGRSLIRGGVCSSVVRGRVREEREEGPRSMTRNGHGPPGGVGVMAAAGKEKGGKVVEDMANWSLINYHLFVHFLLLSEDRQKPVVNGNIDAFCANLG